ncbi:transketolase [Bosea sp. AAP35]|uniref:transketolase C-terminal domain-containing protein n=1 Tax=Bosea sp. AAP35 TaxID=1523417 RepID=UPI0006B9C01E|nr:transketolase C-terminal domain-containing protein [Bosea sp. AAP35]KPF66572.1 transketolase [Bosea sp. AAP35]
MGDLIGQVVETELYFIERSEFVRVKGLNAPRPEIVSLYADMARLNVLYMVAKAGSGHLGSSFSSLDIISHLYLSELDVAAGDIFFSSKGHDAPGLYAVLDAEAILPEGKIHALRRLEGLPGHPDVGTPGMTTNTGSLGMGISKAKGIAFANRLAGRRNKIVVMTGDGELQEGQIWESLISAANQKTSELVVIVDHNKIQSDYSVEKTSSLGDLVAKFTAFGWHVERLDGHDTEALAACFERIAKIADKPKVIIADTVKGRGVSFMEGTAIDSDVEMFKFHSGAPKADEYQRAVEEIEARTAARLAELSAEPIRIERVDRPIVVQPTREQKRLVPAYTRTLLDRAEQDPALVALSADLALDMGLIEFAARFPDRFVECGIAEQDMVSQAGGMALKGLLPVVHSFSCFLSTRPNEQIYNNATEHTKIVYVGGLSGVLPAGPGHSHQSVREISALGGIPGMVMVEPCCPEEVGPLFDWCARQHDGPSFLRLVSVPYATDAVLPPRYAPKRGCGVEIRPGSDGVIVAAGLVAVAEALEAADILSEAGQSFAVVNLPWLNVVDPSWLADLATHYPRLVTIDNHYRSGGQGQTVLAALAMLDLPQKPSVLSIGIESVPPSGRNDEVLAALGMDGASLAQRIQARFAAVRT